MAAISRKLVVPALAVGAVILAGAAYGVTKYRNIPGDVTGSYKGGIKGTFTYKVDPSGIASNGYGGACLIVRAKDLNEVKGVNLDWMEKKHCTQDSDCSKKDVVYGYCDTQNNQCWGKPIKPTLEGADPLACLKFKPPHALVVDNVNTISASHTDLVTMQIPPHAKVRVLTCLNGIPGGGCAVKGNPAQHEFGKPKQL